MAREVYSSLIVVLALVFGLLLPEPAYAFRCGSKLIIEGMHEQQVIGICGEPATIRHLGYALRGQNLRIRRHLGSGWTVHHDTGLGHISEEVAITEYVYNFGPRKLMQRLVFEGGVLMTIETIGYGYRERSQ